MKGQPVLPARRLRQGAARLHEGKEQAPLLDRLRALHKLQPDILSAVSGDATLQAAAAADPQLAQLLDPGMVTSVLQLLQEGTSDTDQLRPDQQDTLKVLSSNRKALVQLQNYAVQLQATRQGRMQLPHTSSHVSRGSGLNSSSSSSHGADTNGQQPQGPMWDQMQQRLQKYQQRDVALQARLVGLGLAPKRLQANPTQSPAPASPGAAAATSSSSSSSSSRKAERAGAARSGGEQQVGVACADVAITPYPEGISRIATAPKNSRLPFVSLAQPSTPSSPFATVQPDPAAKSTAGRRCGAASAAGAAGAPPAAAAVGRARAPAAAALLPLPVAAGVPNLTLALPASRAAAACGIHLGASPTAAGAAAAAATAAAGPHPVQGLPGGLGPTSSMQAWPAAAAAAASAALMSSAVPQAQGAPANHTQQQQQRHMSDRPTVLVPHSPLTANSWPCAPPAPWVASPKWPPALATTSSAAGGRLPASSTAARARVSDSGGAPAAASAGGGGAGGWGLRAHGSSPLLLQVPAPRGPAVEGPPSAQSSLASTLSNSQAFQRVFSGECIVEIPPPTKLATNLSWTTSPSAGYLIEASSSSQLPEHCLSPSWPGSGSGLPLSAGPFHSASSCGSMAGSLGRGGGSTASLLRVRSIREINEEGLEGDCDVEQGKAGQQQQQQRVDQAHMVGSDGACDLAASPTARATRKHGGPAAADKTAAAKRGRTTAAAAAASVAAAMQHRTPEDGHLQPQGSSQREGWMNHHQQQQHHHHHHQQQQHQQRRPTPLEVLQGGMPSLLGPTSPSVGPGLVPTGGVAAAAWGPRYYYEHVAASSWQPEEGSSCWALYRRAYCSQGEALVPPLWMAAVALLSFCHLPFLLLPLAALAALLLLHRLLVGPQALKGSAAAAGVVARGVPSFVVSLECVASGVLVTGLLPVTWQGHAGLCSAAVVTAAAVLVLHLRTYLQDPGYLPHPTSRGAAAADRCSHSSSGSSSDAVGNGGPSEVLPGEVGSKGYGDLHPLVEAEGATVVVRILPAAGPATGHGPSADGGTTSSCPGVSTPLSSPCGTGPRHPTAATTTSSASSAWQASPSKTTSRYRGSDRPASAAAAAAAAAGLVGEDGQLGSKQQAVASARKQLGGGAEWPEGAAAAAPCLSTCWTCGVERTLRSKHCPYCNRCVSRMDHHCSVVANCVGAGNQRTFTAYLAALVLGHGFFLAVLWASLAGEATTAAAAVHAAAAAAAAAGISGPTSSSSSSSSRSSSSSGANGVVGGLVLQGGAGSGVLEGSVSAWRVVALGAAHHPGWLLLGLFMVATLSAACALLLRQLGNIAANLTTNEWANRARYIYLQHDSGGYANRFDRGPAHNCWSFWAAPQGGAPEGWAEWEAGERMMRFSGQPYTTPWSAGRLIRRWDDAWATWRERLRSSRQRRAEAALQRRLRALGLGEGAR